MLGKFALRINFDRLVLFFNFIGSYICIVTLSLLKNMI